MLAKLCPSPNNDAHLIGTINATTDSMTEMMTLNWKQVDAIVKQIKGELENADKEFEKLNKIVLENLEHLEQLINDPDQVGRNESAIDESPDRYMTMEDMDDDDDFLFERVRPSRYQELLYLIEKDGPGFEDQQPQNSLLEKALENLEELKQTTDRKFDSVLKSLKEAKNEANDRMRYQEQKREKVETNLRNIQESLKDLLKARLSQSSVQSSRPNYITEPQIQV